MLKASWDPKGERIAAGSGDQSVAIWESRTGKLLNKLPGHKGTVNDVRFSPGDGSLCKSFPIRATGIEAAGCSERRLLTIVQCSRLLQIGLCCSEI